MSLRDKMPLTAVIVDDFRAEFGEREVNGEIRAGMAGVPGRFFASENGHEVGTRATDGPGVCISGHGEVVRHDRKG